MAGRPIPQVTKECCPAPLAAPDVRPVEGPGTDEELSALARALAHPARVQIVRLLARRGTCICGEIVPGTIYSYIAFNLRDPILKDARVREALDYAIDRDTIIHYLWRDMAERSASVLPVQHWANDTSLQPVPYEDDEVTRLIVETCCTALEKAGQA